MSELQQYRIDGQAYFFTVAFPARCVHVPLHQIRAFCLELVQIKQNRPFHLDALVIMPKYVQGILTLSGDAAQAALRWQQLKHEFIHMAGGLDGPEAGNEADFEHKRFFGYALNGDQDFASHLHFLHYNPVNQGLVKGVADWPYSTFFQYVRQGVYPLSWSLDVA